MGAVRRKEEKEDIRDANRGMKAFEKGADEDQEDSTGGMDTERDENDAPKDTVALSIDERMKAFNKEEAVSRKQKALSVDDRMAAFDKLEHEEEAAAAEKPAETTEKPAAEVAQKPEAAEKPAAAELSAAAA